MSDEAETPSIREELRLQFRQLCMGRPIAAERLADMLAPLLEKPAGDALPVIDMQALTTSELAALSTVAPEPVTDASLDEHIQHVQAALASEMTVGEQATHQPNAANGLDAVATSQQAAPAASTEPAPAKTTTKARKAR